MVRVGVISDSHCDRAALREAASRLQTVDQVVHLGDCAPDAQLLESLLPAPVLSVRGNCDYASSQPEEITIQLGGVQALLCHGHRYQVKSTLQLLCYRAQEVEAHLALFGHTHRPLVTWEQGVLLVNPGSLSGGYGGPGHYVVLEFRENGVVPISYELP